MNLHVLPIKYELFDMFIGLYYNICHFIHLEQVAHLFQSNTNAF